MRFSNYLINWYLQNKRDLPWRKTKDPYLVWLSEIMLQQTRIEQGLGYFLKFKEAYPTVFDLANASEEEVLKLWQGLGYYSRARNLHATAKLVVNENKGLFPNTYKELLALKGVGDYTASAIGSICYNLPDAVVDGNVYRVLARYYGIATPINTTKGIKEFKALAQELIDKDQPGVFNQAIMDFGSTQCKPQNPNCSICVLNDSCVALEKDLIKTLPVKEKKLKVRNRYFNYLVVLTDDKRTVLHQREGKGIWQGLYEFPCIETTKSIQLDELISNSKFIEYGFDKGVISQHQNKEVVHKLSHQHIYTKFWIVKLKDFQKTNTSIDAIETLPVPVLIANFLIESEEF